MSGSQPPDRADSPPDSHMNTSKSMHGRIQKCARRQSFAVVGTHQSHLTVSSANRQKSAKLKDG